jgi:Mrp family chromosome partitioning ATPase
MNIFHRRPSPSAVGAANFDLLRARLENDVPRPAVIAITSSTAEDGKEIAARGLACSLALAGYQTLLIDTSVDGYSLARPGQGPELEEIARQLTFDPRAGNLVELILKDAALQKRTSQRKVQLALEILRNKADYVVISTESGASTPFGAAVVAAASAVLVTVKRGRRQKGGDAQLAVALKRLGARFLGVLALDKSITIADHAVLSGSGTNDGARRAQPAHVAKEYARQEAAG